LCENKIIAIAGLEKKLGIIRGNLILKKTFHGKGLGKRIVAELITEAARKRYPFIMAVISDQNLGSVTLHKKIGYRLIGTRQNLSYYVLPLTCVGKLLCASLNAIFPLFLLIDLVRR